MEREDDQRSQAELLLAFGRWLGQERELRDMRKDEIAASTRLSAGVIDALESGLEERMPPRAYVVGYLRAYAGAVGLDADEVVLRWQEAVGEEPAPEPPRSLRRFLPVLVAAVALGVVAAMVLGALLRSGR
jgi:cytoskeletal protein RodZ